MQLHLSEFALFKKAPIIVYDFQPMRSGKFFAPANGFSTLHIGLVINDVLIAFANRLIIYRLQTLGENIRFSVQGSNFNFGYLKMGSSVYLEVKNCYFAFSVFKGLRQLSNSIFFTSLSRLESISNSGACCCSNCRSPLVAIIYEGFCKLVKWDSSNGLRWYGQE